MLTLFELLSPYISLAINALFPLTVGSTVILNEDVTEYTCTIEVLDSGGVVGTPPDSDQIRSERITNGDGIASAKGAFLVPVRLESSAIPVLDAV